jgi:hypothetical protein
MPRAAADQAARDERAEIVYDRAARKAEAVRRTAVDRADVAGLRADAVHDRTLERIEAARQAADLAAWQIYDRAPGDATRTRAEAALEKSEQRWLARKQAADTVWRRCWSAWRARVAAARHVEGIALNQAGAAYRAKTGKSPQR